MVSIGNKCLCARLCSCYNFKFKHEYDMSACPSQRSERSKLQCLQTHRPFSWPRLCTGKHAQRAKDILVGNGTQAKAAPGQTKMVMVSVLCIQPEPLPHHSHKSQTNPQQYRFGSNWRSFWVARPHGVGCLTNLGDALSLLGRILFGTWALRKENFLHFAKASVHVPPNYLISQWNPCTS